MSRFVEICKVGDVPTGETRMFMVDQRAIGVFNIAGQFYAMDDRCPHAGASLSHGTVEGDVVRCRIHHWQFCIRKGKYLDEAKPKFNVRTFSIRVVGDQVQIEMDSDQS